MEEWRRRMVTPQQGVRSLARSSQGSMCVMFELVVTFPAHPAFAGASRHTNNTDELSGFIIFVFTNFSQIKGLCLEVLMFVFCCCKSRFQTPQESRTRAAMYALRTLHSVLFRPLRTMCDSL